MIMFLFSTAIALAKAVVLGVKAANNALFKAFYNDAQMEQNC